MEDQLALQRLLHRSLLEARARNPRISLRSFAKRIGLAPSATSELLRGQRRASRKLATRIARKLLLDPQETHRLLSNFPGPRAPSRRPVTAETHRSLKLSADQFALISDWVHYAILSLVRTRGFRSEPAWIAGRLGVARSRVTTALGRLERLGLLVRGSDGGLSRAYVSVHTSDDVLDISIQRAHLADMELAKEALTSVPVDLRDFTSMTMPASVALLPKAKAAIRRFRDELVEILAEEPGAEVYQASIYLYPLTQVSRPHGASS